MIHKRGVTITIGPLVVAHEEDSGTTLSACREGVTLLWLPETRVAMTNTYNVHASTREWGATVASCRSSLSCQYDVITDDVITYWYDVVRHDVITAVSTIYNTVRTDCCCIGWLGLPVPCRTVGPAQDA